MSLEFGDPEAVTAPDRRKAQRLMSAAIDNLTAIRCIRALLEQGVTILGVVAVRCEEIEAEPLPLLILDLSIRARSVADAAAEAEAFVRVHAHHASAFELVY